MYVLVGLPGSGKSTFIDGSFHDEQPDVLVFDDYQSNAIANQPDPQWSRNRSPAIEALRAGQSVLISDVNYCRKPALDRVVSLMRDDVPGIDIELMYFANDPSSAEHNVRLRGRDELQRELKLIEALSKEYLPPEVAMPIVRGTAPLDERA
nr:AAA family ATPase [Nocardioides ochotonae]